jgi:heme oxygenase (biliverdin-IX-beta and delta-forming)
MSGTKKAKKARDLFLSDYQGILSTHSVDVSGYPFGSVVPYCLNKNGLPIILISAIAQHTKNILSDPKVSLTVTEGDGVDDLQTVGRVTYLGDAEMLDQNDTDSIERYYTYFPQSRDYHQVHDFDFYIIKPVRIRFIGGFGQIFWIEKDEFILANPFTLGEEKQMLDHMNADHYEAIRHYCELCTIPYKVSQTLEMIGIDSEGFHLRVGSRIHRINFTESVFTAEEVRACLVEMAKA